MSVFFASLMAEPLGKPLTLALIIIAIQNANIFKLNVTEKDNYIVARILALLSLFINEPMLEIVVLTLMAVLVVKTLVKEIDNALRLFFNQLKVEGIYVDDEPDEDYVNYLEEMS